ncbi:MAG: spore germination protein, partial [Christensenellaceae bacterium]|nr:spore germination protein [Christensenellaceae bacterium]
MQAADKTQSIKDEIKKGLGESCDISVKTCETVKGVCVYAYEDALINKETLFRDILPYLKSDGFDGDIHNFVACDCKSTKDIDSLCQGVLGGCLGLYFDEKYYLFSIQSWEKRSVTIPEAENVIRGPKEGFTEDLQTNISLIRRKIKNKNLILEKHIIGRQSNTSLCICYMNGIADPEIVKGITDKITAIDVDGVFDVGQIEQLIEEKPMHSVAGMGMTQKPDVCAMR